MMMMMINVLDENVNTLLVFSVLCLSILSQNIHGQCNCRLDSVASCEAMNTCLSTFGKNSAYLYQNSV